MTESAPFTGIFSFASNSRPLYPSVEALLKDAALANRLRRHCTSGSMQDRMFFQQRHALDIFFQHMPSDVNLCFDENSQSVVAFAPSRSEFSIAFLSVSLLDELVLEEEGALTSSAVAPPPGAKFLLLLIPRKNREYLLVIR
jgi:hypothetical protein